jgi:hypothetical protein
MIAAVAATTRMEEEAPVAGTFRHIGSNLTRPVFGKKSRAKRLCHTMLCRILKNPTFIKLQ